MFKYAKLSFTIFLTIWFIVPFYIAAATYINDPLQVWHKPLYRPIKYSNMRESAHARIRNSDFDSVIIGNSWSECISAKKTGEILGGQFINLSMTGSNMLEKKLILEKTFKNHNIKRVIYILDTHYLDLDKSTYNDNWKVLYDKNPFNDFKIYMNDKYLLCNLFFCNMNNTFNTIDIDKADDWEKRQYHNGRFGGFQNWIKYYPQNEQIKEAFKYIYMTEENIYTQDIDDNFKNGIKKYFDDYVFQLVKNNPNVEFDFVVSPKCNLQLAIDIRNEVFNKTKYAIMIFANENDKYKNSKLFAFDDLNSIGKIDDYKDGSHYRSWINYFIIQAINDNRNRLTSSNYNEYIDKVYTKAKNVDFRQYQQQVKKIYVNQ